MFTIKLPHARVSLSRARSSISSVAAGGPAGASTCLATTFAVVTAAAASLLPAGMAEAMRYALALFAERMQATRCGC